MSCLYIDIYFLLKKYLYPLYIKNSPAYLCARSRHVYIAIIMIIIMIILCVSFACYFDEISILFTGRIEEEVHSFERVKETRKEWHVWHTPRRTLSIVANFYLQGFKYFVLSRISGFTCRGCAESSKLGQPISDKT